MSTDTVRARGPRSAEEDERFRARRRARQLVQELVVRTLICLLVLAYNETVGFGAAGRSNAAIRILALLGIVLNAPVYLATRAAGALHRQAYVRMGLDLVLMTLGFSAAGGLAAAPYLGLYAIVPIYFGFSISATAAVAATAAGVGGFLATVFVERAGWLAASAVVPPGAWGLAVYNLALLVFLGGVTAMISHAYHGSQHRLAALYQELERAYDETSRLNTEIQRAARFHVLGEVVAGVTHEIGNALQGAILSVDLVRQKVGGAAIDVARNLEQIEYGCATAMRIVKNVLLTARQSSDDRLPVSFADIARRTVELKGYDLRRDGIVLQLDFPRDHPRVLGSPFRLQQVLLNLVTNAQDALRNRTGTRSIAVVGSTDIKRVVLEVRDNGPGIPVEVMPRLFEPFYTTKPQGTGLGLAISADIVRGLGGDLTARNHPEGGAVFRISLPTAEHAAGRAPGRDAAPTPAAEGVAPPPAGS